VQYNYKLVSPSKSAPSHFRTIDFNKLNKYNKLIAIMFE